MGGGGVRFNSTASIGAVRPYLVRKNVYGHVGTIEVTRIEEESG